MRTISATVVVLAALISFLSTSALRTAPKFTLDLDLPPYDRWGQAVELIASTYGWNNSFGPVVAAGEILLKFVPPRVIAELKNILQTRFIDKWDELCGIHDAASKMGHNFTMDLLTISPFMYELEHASDLIPHDAKQKYGLLSPKKCCGILSLPEDRTKSMIHGRNLDAPPRQSRNVTLHITVVRNNGTYFYNAFGGNWLSAALFTTARLSRSDGLTLEQNTRLNPPNEQNHTVAQIVAKLSNSDTMPASFLFRHINDNAMDYDEALWYLLTVDLAAPMYFIMSGPQRRGAVLSVDFDKRRNVMEVLDDSRNLTFVVQSNYDRWKPDPPSDPRRSAAERVMMDVGHHRSGSKFGVFMALSTYPVHNVDTLFTALMRVDEQIEGYVREAMVPSE